MQKHVDTLNFAIQNTKIMKESKIMKQTFLIHKNTHLF